MAITDKVWNELTIIVVQVVLLKLLTSMTRIWPAAEGTNTHWRSQEVERNRGGSFSHGTVCLGLWLELILLMLSRDDCINNGHHWMEASKAIAF